jgi:dTDP-4-dehydrorhamnose reductase
MRRNGDAAGAVARACADAGAALVLLSTNEVFDGERSDNRGYTERDAPNPRNPYGVSKVAGELAAHEAFVAGPGLWIVRTAWLYGPPGRDFPSKILAASDRLRQDDSLAVVADEHGSPTLASDLASAILALVEATEGGVFHLVNDGTASRYEWAERVLHRCRPGRRLRPITRHEFARVSDPPPWAVLDATHAGEVAGVRLRSWRDALDDYLPTIC